MDASRLMPESIDGEKKQKAIQDAKDMYQLVVKNCERTKSTVPPYDFFELIGKGGSARVYKCRSRQTGDLVAVKIVNTDDVDFTAYALDRDDTVRDFRKEVNILQQLKDSKAKNVNIIHDAFDLQEQLWIVSDYCTGGSVRTLMRAQPPGHPGLDEQHIITVARELAIAIKSVHEIGVIHRDIKCTNVYVTEDGDIQLGDFGIVGVLDDGGVSKRRTIIGTPHYMPREMLVSGPSNTAAEAYGTEVDIWSFGCTVYEMATGLPPNAQARNPDAISMALINAPRLEGDQYSEELRDFVAFCLNSDPQARPSADAVLKHPYIANTQKKYPTRKLIDLIHRFKAWEYGGGWRQSLFMVGGAPPVSASEDPIEGEDFDDWNFSTSDGFNTAFEKRYSQMLLSKDSDQTKSGLPLLDTNLSPLEKLRQAHQDMSADRGERSLDRLFSPDSAPYELHTPIDEPGPISDLPFRNMTAGAPTRESQIIIDLDSAEATDSNAPAFNFEFGDIPTIKAGRARQHSFNDDEDDDDNDDNVEEKYSYNQSQEDQSKRITMDWKFPKRATMDWTFSSAEPKEPDEPDAKMHLPPAGGTNGPPPAFRPTLKHTTTEPVGQFKDHMHPLKLPTISAGPPVRESVGSMIDLDFADEDPNELVRPMTATSTTGSTMTDMTSGNPFDLEDDAEQNEIDRNRFSYHKQWQSEGGQVKRSSRRSVPMHARGSSLSSTTSDRDRTSSTDDDVFQHEYKRRVSKSLRKQLNSRLAEDDTDLDKWPDFGPHSGYDRVRGWNDGLDDSATQQRNGQPQYADANDYSRPSTSGNRARQPEIEFPRILPPHAEALMEGADPAILERELNRLLDDFGASLTATANAMQLYGDLDDGSDLSESDSELDNGAFSTEDEGNA